MRALALASALVLLAADASLAARLVDVRIGTHPDYARVVLETDAPAVHEILTLPAAASGEVVVRIAASSVARVLPGRGAGAPEVVLEPQPDGTTLARIRAAGPVRVETQVLRAPPRLVLDLREGAAAVEPVPVAEAEPEPEAVAAAPEPEPPPAPEAPLVPEPEPAPEPAPALGSEPVPPAQAAAPVEAPVEEATPPALAPPPAETPPLVAPAPEPEPVVAPEPPVAAEPPTPPVESPPPAVIAFEPRSLAVGAALGIGLALVGFAALRERRAAPAAAEPELRRPIPLPPLAPRAASVEAPAEEVANATPPEAGPATPAPDDGGDPELAEDLVRMHRRLDARLAEVAERLDAIAARQAELDRHEGTQTHEIAAQRAAIARLQRALRPPLRPRKTEKDTG